MPSFKKGMEPGQSNTEPVRLSEDSESLPDNGSGIELGTVGKTNRALAWEKLPAFATRKELDEFLVDKAVTRHYENSTDDGICVYYRCSELPKRLALKCPVRVKVFEDDTTIDFKCEFTTFAHDHSNLNYNPKIKQFVKEKIFELRMQHRMKPKQIRKYLQTEPLFKDEPTPTIRSIRYALDTAMDIKIVPTFTYGQFIEWCGQMSAVPSNEDESFVIAQKHNEQDNSLTFIMSTLRCLKHAMNCQNIVADGTYKMNWEEYPIVVVGTLDREQHFHMLAACVTTNERESDYIFVFESIKNAVTKHFNRTMEPYVLVSDAAYPIRNAFYKAFLSAKENVVCWAHVARNLNDFKFENNHNYDPIKKDIDIVQASPDITTFQHVASLFIEKWEIAEPEFCEYFKKTWVVRSNTWFGGYSSFVPATNNGNEGFNLCLKRDYTLRERLPFNTFKVIFKNMITDLSQQYSNTCGKKPKQIVYTPFISIDDYRTALGWLEDPLNKVVRLESNTVFTNLLVISSKFKATITDDATMPSSKEVKELNPLDYTDFDEYKKSGYGMTYRLHIDQENWKTKSHCECINFQKQTMCKHIIGIALSLNLEKCPPEAKISKLPQKKKKKAGRRAKAKPALQRQND